MAVQAVSGGRRNVPHNLNVINLIQLKFRKKRPITGSHRDSLSTMAIATSYTIHIYLVQLNEPIKCTENSLLTMAILYNLRHCLSPTVDTAMILFLNI